MKIVGILFYLASLYYLIWFFVSSQVGSEIGFVVLLATGSLFYFLTSSESPNKKWFGAKAYGYGWGLPRVWQGWVIYLVYFFSTLLTVLVIATTTHSVSDTFIGLIPTVGLLTATLIAICYKYGEKPEWRWGKKRSS